MARTPSTMPTLGIKAPFFKLTDVTTEKKISLDDFNGKPLLVMFICNHCPYVIHIRKELSSLTNEYIKKGVGIVGINSNDIKTYPEDAPDKMKSVAHESHFSFPYLLDSTQSIAKAYQAACTPDFFLFDKNHLLVYRGQMDGSRPGNTIPNNGVDLRQALEMTLHDQKPALEQKPSLGCNIKWREGNEPSYF